MKKSISRFKNEKVVMKQMLFKFFVAQFDSLLTLLIILNLVAIILALVCYILFCLLKLFKKTYTKTIQLFSERN